MIFTSSRIWYLLHRVCIIFTSWELNLVTTYLLKFALDCEDLDKVTGDICSMSIIKRLPRQFLGIGLHSKL